MDLSGFTLGVIRSVALGKCVMTCIHPHRIIQNDFTALKIPCPAPVHQLLPSPPGTTGLFTVSVVLPFPGGHMLESYSM